MLGDPFLSISSRLIATMIMVMKIGCQYSPIRVQFIALMSNLSEGNSGFLTAFGTLGNLFSLNLSLHKKNSGQAPKTYYRIYISILS